MPITLSCPRCGYDCHEYSAWREHVGSHVDQRTELRPQVRVTDQAQAQAHRATTATVPGPAPVRTQEGRQDAAGRHLCPSCGVVMANTGADTWRCPACLRTGACR